MKLDRDLQRHLLQSLSTFYPDWVTIHSDIFDGVDRPVLLANLAYLIEHGLVDGANSAVAERLPLGLSSVPLRVKISAAGLDFIAQDGGLSAILGTVTVKLHADTIRDMLETKILASALSTEDKNSFTKTLKELPGEALKTFTNKLVEMACDNPQAVWTMLKGIAS
ncbi:hypothetical protein NK214_11050 [Chromobacterium sp. S0633]|uniref:hypothetical protein n=1 Tax=Chromobacterium sp. S0633 TaxID=2957805 RepID=UPI0020A054E1|nr:hypothetical protein [Chromobacterium sp. S0633]MCP1290726.1 hypothetical protein [Chromobacterium sp. S0633]